MTVKLNSTGTYAEISWDTQLVGGGHEGHKVKITATKPDGTDASTRDNLTNDGLATFTFPDTFTGDAHFKVEGPHGTDEGVITL